MKYHVRNIKHSAWHEKTYYKNDFPFFSYVSTSHINPVKKKSHKKILTGLLLTRGVERKQQVVPFLYFGEGSLALMF